MKKLFNDGWKKIQQNSIKLEVMIILLGYFFIILFSIKNNNLFLKELIVSGLIIVLAFLSNNSRYTKK